MTAQQWKSGRQAAGLTQVQAARALGVSQPYLSQLEKGTRPGIAALVLKAADIYKLPPTALPLPSSEDLREADEDDVFEDLAALGYPGFAYLGSDRKSNPAHVVLSAVLRANLNVRAVEGLPWILSTYTDLDWSWLRDNAKLRNVQNRVGYLVHLAKGVPSAEPAVPILSVWERDLEEARLAHEDTLCRASMVPMEREWLREHRPDAAKHWNLLTRIVPEHLWYATHC